MEDKMQTTSRLFDDLAKVAGGAVSTFGAVKEEIETRVKERVERLMAEMDLPTADEVAAVRAMAQKAREEQDVLMERIAALEARVAILEKTASEID
jgi:BMFP domain-containing protein YqiC